METPQRMKHIAKFVQFASDRLTLEGMLSAPASTRPTRGVLLCHPHPQYGGDMDNNVVRAVAAALESSEFTTLRFNFRGVHGSDGVYDEGRGELVDVLSAISFLGRQPGVDPSGILLVGYSFGSFVGMLASLQTTSVLAAALISPPLSRYDFSFIADVTVPLLIICGDRDQFCSLEDLETMYAKLKAPAQKLVLKRVDHFYWGRESLASEAVRSFFLSLRL